MALNKSIFATLFPHLKPELPPISAAFTPKPSPFALSEGVSGDGYNLNGGDGEEGGAPLDYAQAAEMQNRINYDAAAVAPPVVAPTVAAAAQANPQLAAPTESIQETLNKNYDFDPTRFNASLLEKTIKNQNSSPLEQKRKEYEDALSAPVKKQSPFLQALFLALQGSSKIFGNDQTPIQFLGNARHNRRVQEAAEQLAPLQALQDKKTSTERQQTDWEVKHRKDVADAAYAEKRPDFELAKIDQKGKEIDSRDAANKMRVVSSLVNKMPDFDPDDPDNEDVVNQLRELRLPVFKKEANRQIKYVQDEESGEMFVVSTNKQTGETQAQQIASGGQPLKLTTKSVIGMRIKDLDRKSQESIAVARNKTTIDAANINAGSRINVANINQKGATERNDATNKVRVQLGEKTKGMTANQLLPKLTDYAKKNFMTLDQAKEAFKNSGIDVDGILKR